MLTIRRRIAETARLTISGNAARREQDGPAFGKVDLYGAKIMLPLTRNVLAALYTVHHRDGGCHEEAFAGAFVARGCRGCTRGFGGGAGPRHHHLSVSGPLSAPPSMPGSVILENFDGTTYPGVTEVSKYNNPSPPGGQTTCPPGVPGVTCSTGILSSGTAEFPAPPGDTTNFLALSVVPIPNFVYPIGYVPPFGETGFFDLLFPSDVTSVSFYTGNVSAYTAVDILHDSTVTSFLATDLGIVGPSGREVTFNFAPSDNVTGIQLVIGYNTTDGLNGTAGFDVDNFTATLASTPEPPSLAVLAIGVAAVLGLSFRRRLRVV